ncbi:MAG: peptidoglycan-binding domain-containing protein [Candidatus Acidiferrales bacterium]
MHRKTKKSHHYTHHRYSRRRYHHRVVLPRAPSPERITQIQTALARGGYYKGDPSGKWDSGTVAAVQKFQSANNIDATGKLDAPTLQKLGLGSDIAGVAAPKPVVPKVCCTTTTPAPTTTAPAKPAGSIGGAPASDRAQPVSTASGNSPSTVGTTGASSAAAVTPAAALSGSGSSGTSDPASATKPAATQH